RPWPDGLPEIDVCPVELPGRGVRLGEPPSPDLTRLCDDVLAAIDELPALPLAVFGHSMGAKIAFELARRLDDRLVHPFAPCAPRARAPRAPGGPPPGPAPAGPRRS